jgi:SulP family sulfate permease
MVMFGIASLMVGIVFFLLGKFQMGKIVYFFPTHVLIGLIGGIGVLLCKTGLENTLAKTVSIASMVEGYNLWLIVVALELILRILEYATTNSKGNAKFALLSPIFFCMITPCFYLTLWVAKIPISEAKQAGYFFPSMNNVGESDVSMDVKFGTPFDLWKVCIELAIAPYKF